MRLGLFARSGRSLGCLLGCLLLTTWLINTPAAGVDGDQPQAAASNVVPPFEVPPGFEVTIAAGPDLVRHPMMAGFDERGRLFVAESAGMNLRTADLEEQLPNSIRMLEDTDGDGRFDRSTVFADKMTFPMGALWHRGALYVASPPYIWRLKDTDDDGVADQRDILVGKFGYTGNAADVHGCFLGPNGRIYWCDGRHGHEFTDEDGKVTSKGLAARVFSVNDDGSDPQVFAGGGMDNPVEVTFAPTGEMFGTMTFYNPDKERHDALVHFAYGGVYPRIHPCLDEFKRTGPLMPPLSKFGVVAPSGLTRYRGQAFGKEHVDNLFSVQFNTHKVLRHVLTRDGATFRCEDHDFVVSDDPDFHPTDVLEDADGSLLVIDTGGWFRIGCPTSQVAKPEIAGAIYRIRYVGERGKQAAQTKNAAGVLDGSADDPRGFKLPWQQLKPQQLIALLGSQWPAVRDRAREELIEGADGATVAALTEQLETSTNHDLRRRAVWTLSRISKPALRDAVEMAIVAALTDPHEDVRQAAARSLGVMGLRGSAADQAIATLGAMAQGNWVSRAAASEGQQAELPQVRATAAATLGQLRAVQTVPNLLAGLRNSSDRFVEHALIYALIEIDNRQATLAGLEDESPAIRRGALIALDQMDSGQLTQQIVGALLDTEDEQLQTAALDVISRHEGWGQQIVGLMQGWLTDGKPLGQRAATARGVLLAFKNDPAVQQLVVQGLKDGSAEHKQLMLEVLARSEFADSQQVPAPWREALDAALQSGDKALLGQAVSTVAATAWPGYEGRLREIAAADKHPRELRAAALVAAARQGSKLTDAEFKLLAAQLADDVLPLDRMAAAQGIASAALTSAQLRQLAELLTDASPLELPTLLPAFAKSSDQELGRLVVAALEKSPGLSSLRPNDLERALTEFPAEIREAASKLAAKSQVGREEQLAKLAHYEQRLAGGDPVLGKAIFKSNKTACVACHRAENEGGNIGPDLSRIGEVRTGRDLLEAVLFPSVSFARGYESYAVLTADGHSYVGVIQRETPEMIYLRTADRSEVRILRADIEEMLPSNISVMPEGLEKTMTAEELAHLVAYLRTLKP